MPRLKVLMILRVSGFLWGFLMFLFASQEILSRLLIDVSGTVVSAEVIHPEKGSLGNPHRFYTKYKVVDPQTGNTTLYKAKGHDAALSRSLPIGTNLEKRRWEINYLVNGKRISDFPLLIYSILWGVGLAFISAGLMAHIQLKKLPPIEEVLKSSKK